MLLSVFLMFTAVQRHTESWATSYIAQTLSFFRMLTFKTISVKFFEELNPEWNNFLNIFTKLLFRGDMALYMHWKVSNNQGQLIVVPHPLLIVSD